MRDKIVYNRFCLVARCGQLEPNFGKQTLSIGQVQTMTCEVIKIGLKRNKTRLSHDKL